jgi:hypothetical protein
MNELQKELTDRDLRLVQEGTPPGAKKPKHVCNLPNRHWRRLTESTMVECDICKKVWIFKIGRFTKRRHWALWMKPKASTFTGPK